MTTRTTGSTTGTGSGSVASWAAARARVADTAQRHVLASRDARWNVNGDLAFATQAPFTFA